MCSKFPFFIHHDPDEGIDKDARRIRYKTTLLTYKDHFGESPPRLIWPEDMYQNESVVTKNQRHRQDTTMPSAVCGTKTYIILPTGQLLTIRNINFRNTTVNDLKHEINKLTGIPMDDMRLIYSGNTLEEYDYHNLQDETTIHLVTKLLYEVGKSPFVTSERY